MATEVCATSFASERESIQITFEFGSTYTVAFLLKTSLLSYIPVIIRHVSILSICTQARMPRICKTTQYPRHTAYMDMSLLQRTRIPTRKVHGGVEHVVTRSTDNADKKSREGTYSDSSTNSDTPTTTSSNFGPPTS